MNIDALESLRTQLIHASTDRERVAILDRTAEVRDVLGRPTFFSFFLQELGYECEAVMKQLAVIQQAIDPAVESMEKWRHLLKISLEIDRFYRDIGGIIGYQALVLRLLDSKDSALHGMESTRFYSPAFDDISKTTPEVMDAIKAGLSALPYLAELYPLGGAADRLHLIDENTQMELPAAKLQFAGRPLLEMLIRDLQAREWLYFRLYGWQIATPIAMMTSHEKDNHSHVLKICEERNWFGRSKESFRFFTQPLVPAVDEKGSWHMTGPLRPHLKPGGHGILWKLARDQGIFAWLQSMGCTKALIRQINNPIAGLDYGLIAFIGIGSSRNLSFGFASCDRIIQSAEGMIVLKESQGRIALTNIEYCDLTKYGIEDAPLHSDEKYSRFHSNTNILFADLEAIEKAVRSHPFPGLLMNIKPTFILDERGSKKEVLLGRLESTMQNIADAFEEPKQTPSEGMKTEKTFVTYNQRHKTISVAKRAYIPGKSLLETPERCFYEYLQSNRELLSQCGFTLPPAISIEQSLSQGPDALFLYHPALGPFYSIIVQKLRGGKLSKGSAFIAELSELDAENLSIEGSLRIQAERILGVWDEHQMLRYSERVGRCILRDICVRNRGIHWAASIPHWKMQLCKWEELEIELRGWSEFDARGVIFEGAHRFVVEDGVRMVVRQNHGRITVTEEKICEKPLWNYAWNNGVCLSGE